MVYGEGKRDKMIEKAKEGRRKKGEERRQKNCVG